MIVVQQKEAYTAFPCFVLYVTDTYSVEWSNSELAWSVFWAANLLLNLYSLLCGALKPHLLEDENFLLTFKEFWWDLIVTHIGII